MDSKKEAYHFVEVQEDPLASKVVSSLDGKHIIAACEDNSIKIFDIESGQQVCQFPNAHERNFESFLHDLIPKEKITSIAVSPDRKSIITGSQDKVIKIFDYKAQRQTFQFETIHTGFDSFYFNKKVTFDVQMQ